MESPVPAGEAGRQVPCLVQVEDLTAGWLGTSLPADWQLLPVAKGPMSCDWLALRSLCYISQLRLPLEKSEAPQTSSSWSLRAGTLASKHAYLGSELDLIAPLLFLCLGQMSPSPHPSSVTVCGDGGEERLCLVLRATRAYQGLAYSVTARLVP